METSGQDNQRLENSEGHNPGTLNEEQQSSDKPMAESPATAGTGNRDEDAADPELASTDTSKGFDRDQQELDLGLDDGDLDTDLHTEKPQDLQENDHQDLSKEPLGNEPEAQTEGDPDSPYHLKGLDDKRPEDEDIKKGWTVDSNTSRGPQELKGENEAPE